MKKKILFLAFSLSIWISTFGQQQWKWLNPQPAGAAGLKIVFSNPQTGYILNSDGQLVKTVDQGGHWQVSGNFPGALCMDIADSTGVIGGYNGILFVSSDNGANWSFLNTGIADQFQFVNIVSRDTFFLSNSSGVIYKTTNRGATWATLNCNMTIGCITFIDSKTGFVGGSGSVILKTVDGGVTWKQVLSENVVPSSILAIHFLNQNTGYASREFDDVLVTHDGGTTWSVSTGVSMAANTIDIVNDSIGYVAGEDGGIFRTGNGGANWTSVTPTKGFIDGNDIYSLFFLTPNTGFAVGLLGRILKTTDGGQTWQSYSPTYNNISAISFPTASTGYLTTGTQVYKTTDSGQSWHPLSLTVGTAYGSSSSFEQAHFVSADTGFVMSSQYTMIYNTTDGGATWSSKSPAPNGYDNTTGISFLDKYKGFISMAGNGNGIIMETTDGGKNWSAAWRSAYSGEYFGKIFYTDESTGYGIRYNQLYRTTDSSRTWTALTVSSNGYQLNDVWFTSKSNGFVVDDEGELFATHDGGNSWQDQHFPQSYSYPINTIKFFNPQIGYLAGGSDFGPGNQGFIYKTVDSGRTWQYSENYGGNHIEFTPDNNVVVAGFGGTVLKSPIGGVQVGSVSVGLSACKETLSASATVALGELDNISFLVTRPDNSVETIAATPSTVKDGQVTCTAFGDSTWVSGATYTVSLRYLYNGSWMYTSPVEFVASGSTKPIITDSAGVLWSNAAYGNQWLLNGSPIPGATGTDWKPLSAGVYSVESNQGGCSLLSDSIKINSSWQADPVTVTQDNFCRETFSTNLAVDFGKADSISFEVTGANNAIEEAPAAPGSIANKTSPVSGSGNVFKPGQTYTVRVRISLNGQFVYGDPVSFTPSGIPKPVIIDSANILTSSYTSGNQWFFNDGSIPGATQSQWTPKNSGNYTVQATIGACVSAMSDPVKIVAANRVVIFPNPVRDQLTLVNSQGGQWSVVIVNMNGKSMMNATISAYQTILSTAQLAPGQYVIYLVNTANNEKITIPFLKL